MVHTKKQQEGPAKTKANARTYPAKKNPLYPNGKTGKPKMTSKTRGDFPLSMSKARTFPAKKNPLQK